MPPTSSNHNSSTRTFAMGLPGATSPLLSNSKRHFDSKPDKRAQSSSMLRNSRSYNCDLVGMSSAQLPAARLVRQDASISGASKHHEHQHHHGLGIFSRVWSYVKVNKAKASIGSSKHNNNNIQVQNQFEYIPATIIDAQSTHSNRIELDSINNKKPSKTQNFLADLRKSTTIDHKRHRNHHNNLDSSTNDHKLAKTNHLTLGWSVESNSAFSSSVASSSSASSVSAPNASVSASSPQNHSQIRSTTSSAASTASSSSSSSASSSASSSSSLSKRKSKLQSTSSFRSAHQTNYLKDDKLRHSFVAQHPNVILTHSNSNGNIITSNNHANLNPKNKINLLDINRSSSNTTISKSQLMGCDATTIPAVDDVTESGDIYSTPSDSVRSVVMIEQPHQNPVNYRKPSSSIVKSFSATNFSHFLSNGSAGACLSSSIVSQQQHQQQAVKGASALTPIMSSSFKPIDERDEYAKVSSNNNHNHSPYPSNGHQHVMQSQRNSRFFVSSSSSEDTSVPTPSATSNGQQSSIVTGGQDGRATPREAFKVQLGVHYHSTTPSLVAMSPQGNHNHETINMSSSTRPANEPVDDVFRELDCFRGQPQRREPSMKPSIMAGNRLHGARMVNSVSLYDYKSLASQLTSDDQVSSTAEQSQACNVNDYKLAEMLLASGSSSNLNLSDSMGYTALMYAILNDNLQATRCLLDKGANPNVVSMSGSSAFDLLSQRPANDIRLAMFEMLCECKQADINVLSERDQSRLIDRLIRDHQPPPTSSPIGGGQGQISANQADKMAYVSCLLKVGAKLASSTWQAAHGKLDIQVELLKKLCYDGYYLYKTGELDASVYRFEYALRRIAELEQQLNGANQSSTFFNYRFNVDASCGGGHLDVLRNQIQPAAKQLKYQIYLGLSRCERKRGLLARALDFAQMAILVDSVSYEAFYSKSHILKDLGQTDDAILVVDQTSRLIKQAIDNSERQLLKLVNERQHYNHPDSSGQKRHNMQSIVDDDDDMMPLIGPFDLMVMSSSKKCAQLSPNRKLMLDRTIEELEANLNYLKEAQDHVMKLKSEIWRDKRMQVAND